MTANQVADDIDRQVESSNAPNDENVALAEPRYCRMQRLEIALTTAGFKYDATAEALQCLTLTFEFRIVGG